MNHNIWLYIRTKTDAAEDALEVKTAAAYYYKKGTHFIFFEEWDQENCSVIKKQIKLCEGHVEQVAKGRDSYRIVLIPGEACDTVVDSGYGKVLMTFRTESYQLKEAPGLEAVLRYEIDLNGAFASQNEMTIKIEPMVC